MKKKVLHILSSRKLSGAENVAITIIKGVNNDYDSKYSSINGDIKDSLKDNEVEFLPLDRFSILEIRKVIKMYKPDIIHSHDFKATIKSCISVSGIPIISHIHQNPNWLSKVNIKTIAFSLASIKLSKVLWVNSNIKAVSYLEYMLRKKSIILENVLNVKKLRELSEKDQSNKFDLIFIGRLVDIKDPVRLINIIDKIKREIPNIKVAIVGEGPLERECRKIIKLKNLEENILLLGYIKNPLSILKNSKGLIMTSKSEGTPMVIIESLCIGKPVIVPNLPTLQDIEYNKLGYICKTDDDYMNAIKIIILNEKKYLRLKDNINRYADKKYNIKAYNDEIIKVYNEVL